MIKCFECGSEAQENHHVIPKSRGGTKTIPLCSPCHGKVHNFRRSDNHAQLTREGLQRAKDRGVILGKPENLSNESRKKGSEAQKQKSKDNVNNKKALPLIIEKRKEGLSYGKIADLLNGMEYKSSRGKKFNDTTVMRIYKKLHLESGVELIASKAPQSQQNRKQPQTKTHPKHF